MPQDGPLATIKSYTAVLCHAPHCMIGPQIVESALAPCLDWQVLGSWFVAGNSRNSDRNPKRQPREAANGSRLACPLRLDTGRLSAILVNKRWSSLASVGPDPAEMAPQAGKSVASGADSVMVRVLRSSAKPLSLWCISSQPLYATL